MKSKKICALLLCAAIAFCQAPSFVFAVGDDPVEGQDQTQEQEQVEGQNDPDQQGSDEEAAIVRASTSGQVDYFPAGASGSPDQDLGRAVPEESDRSIA